MLTGFFLKDATTTTRSSSSSSSISRWTKIIFDYAQQIHEPDWPNIPMILQVQETRRNMVSTSNERIK